MGYYADRSTGRGQLYLVTREEEPFCGELRIVLRLCKTIKMPNTIFYVHFLFIAHQYNIEIFSALSELPLRSLGRWEVTLIGEAGLNETFTITE